jgi:hypothetical protein
MQQSRLVRWITEFSIDGADQPRRHLLLSSDAEPRQFWDFLGHKLQKSFGPERLVSAGRIDQMKRLGGHPPCWK